MNKIIYYCVFVSSFSLHAMYNFYPKTISRLDVDKGMTALITKANKGDCSCKAALGYITTFNSHTLIEDEAAFLQLSEHDFIEPGTHKIKKEVFNYLNEKQRASLGSHKEPLNFKE